MSTTLPIGIPRLDALVRAEADRRAEALDALLPYEQHHGPNTTEIAWAFETLLRDLTRPESRDWAVRAGVDITHRRNEGRPNAPYYEETRDRWLSMRESPAALCLALAEVCRG